MIPNAVAVIYNHCQLSIKMSDTKEPCPDVEVGDKAQVNSVLLAKIIYMYMGVIIIKVSAVDA